MTVAGFAIYPTDAPAQRVRLRRFFVGVPAHVMNLAFVLLWVAFTMTLGQFSFLAGQAEQRARGGLAAHQRHGHKRRYAALPAARPARCGSSISLGAMGERNSLWC